MFIISSTLSPDDLYDQEPLQRCQWVLRQGGSNVDMETGSAVSQSLEGHTDSVLFILTLSMGAISSPGLMTRRLKCRIQ